MGKAKDIYSNLGGITISPSVLAERGKRMIRVTKWLNPASRVRTIDGEISIARWLVREVQYFRREAWVMENREGNGTVAIVTARPPGLKDWPDIYDPDIED